MNALTDRSCACAPDHTLFKRTPGRANRRRCSTVAVSAIDAPNVARWARHSLTQDFRQMTRTTAFAGRASVRARAALTLASDEHALMRVDPEPAALLGESSRLTAHLRNAWTSEARSRRLTACTRLLTFARCGTFAVDARQCSRSSGERACAGTEETTVFTPEPAPCAAPSS
jgi:hypothetical protein